MEHYLHEFPNGIKLLNLPHSGSIISHAAFVIDIGARDEEEFPSGIAHFLEHMLFKGTKKRSSFHILSRLDSVGGELNAYTTKEKITVYASFLNEYMDRALELLTDVVFHSIFPEKEVKKEIRVVLDEIGMYEDNPEENIYDVFTEKIYNQHPLGHNILGNRDSVSSFNPEVLRKFTSLGFNPSRMVIAVSGKITMPALLRKITPWVQDIQASTSKIKRSPPPISPIFRQDVERDFTQAYAVLGGIGYHLHEPQRFSQALLNNLLGGPGMNSLLSLNIREKYGFCYTIYSDLQLFTDSALFSITYGTDAKHVDKTQALVEKTLRKLTDSPLSSTALHKAKKQFIGQMAMGQENRNMLMLGIAKSLLDTGKIPSFEYVRQEIEAITSNDLLECANTIMHPERLHVLRFLPA